MMMMAFAPSAATAYDVTTTSGLGSGLSSGIQSKKLYPNRTKNIEVKNTGYRSALVGWSNQSKISSIHFKLILFVF